MAGNASRWLVVVRHAKSAWPPEVADHDRPLAKRGRRAAPQAGIWLRDAGHMPDHVICSTARRARETWRLSAGTLGASPPVTYDARLYDADMAALLEVIGEQSDDIVTLLLVGHNPSVQQLTLHLAGHAAGDALERARTKFPTCAIAVLTVPGPWARLGTGATRLSEFVVPRGRRG